MKQYTDFVFDIDGTLLDTEQTGVLSLMQTIRELIGKEVPYEEAYYFFGVPSSQASSILGYADEARFAAVWEQHYQELMHLVIPFPGVLEVLEDLHATGVGMGIVTSRSRLEIQYDPHLAKLLPFFGTVVCSADSPRPKPFPDPMLTYLERTGARKEATLFLGDTMHDYRCGHDAGCDFALADWRKRGMQGIAAEYRFTDAASLREILGV